MNETLIQPKRALISVSNKTGIVDFARELNSLGVEIISTGGTATALKNTNIPVIEISDYTGFPEMMNGRVKTMHPKVMGGILGLRDTHADQAGVHNIPWIDLVVCNLYPFSETIQKEGVLLDEAVENIDIGGPTMIRSAAKNMGWVTVIVDPLDYSPLLEELKAGGLSYETRRRLSTKAFKHTAQYDSVIQDYLSKYNPSLTLPYEERGTYDAPFVHVLDNVTRSSLLVGESEREVVPSSVDSDSEEKFPNTLNLTYKKFYDLRYGENPHQSACVYIEPNNKSNNILNAKILQGKQLSYNNVNDADGALATLKEFSEPACVIVKHANPCGVSTGDDIVAAFTRAYEADALSAFGGIFALNRPCTKAIAEAITKVFVEIVLAPSYEPEALELFAAKKNMRVLELGEISPLKERLEYRSVDGGLLVQDMDTKLIEQKDLQIVTKTQPTEQETKDMLFAWKVLKHIKSNGILIAKNNTTVGVGAGQVSRVDAVDIAIRKSGANISASILASDAFFPFRDSIDKIAQTGIKAIIQPGGSVKDAEVIAACDEYGIAMVFTGTRCFKH